MENDPELELEFFLAETLGMTVARLRAEIPAAEFREWMIYFGRKAQRKQLAERSGPVALGGRGGR